MDDVVSDEYAYCSVSATVWSFWIGAG